MDRLSEEEEEEEGGRKVSELLRCGDGVRRCFQDDCVSPEAAFQRRSPVERNHDRVPEMVASDAHVLRLEAGGRRVPDR